MGTNPGKPRFARERAHERAVSFLTPQVQDRTMVQKLDADARKTALARLAGWSEVKTATPSPRR